MKEHLTVSECGSDDSRAVHERMDRERVVILMTLVTVMQRKVETRSRTSG